MTGKRPCARGIRIGVLCVQGGFSEHLEMVRRVGAEAVDVRLPHQLDDIDGLILPGGESTTIGLVCKGTGLIEGIQGFIKKGRPVFGTCAGLIVLCDRGVEHMQKGGQALIGGLHAHCVRNGFGRQVASYEEKVDISPGVPIKPQGEEVFIRAPVVSWVDKDKVQVLATVVHNLEEESEVKDRIVAIRQDFILATSFHPELTEDPTWHSYFRGMVEESLSQKRTIIAA
eukprot:Hpha_TRINITY_DN5839_c0_g1::TRINITY_DN5839_c0_g1_i1::g.45522::m.45522/K08681/pdxT, pdx2; 5'-phosphate synthase pdxT subunit